jgi:hypothetical protein
VNKTPLFRQSLAKPLKRLHMKKKFLLIVALGFYSSYAFSQVISAVNLTGDTKIEPGIGNYVTVAVKNTQKIAIIKHQSPYTVCLIYRGSGNAGLAFNKSVDLGDPLDPGETRNMRIGFTGPILPGEYDVDVVLKWGNKVVSNVEKATFVVAENYKVDISAKTTSYYIERGGTRDIDIRFMFGNSGHTAWPEGKYSLDFDVVSTPSGASSYDKAAFAISPKNVELWEFEPGVEDEFVYQDFKPPFTDGTYVVKVTLLLNGKPFDAEGNGKNISFKIDVK